MSAKCLCCSQPMLRHTRGASVYWFCRTCWQEMPLCDAGGHSSPDLPRKIGLDLRDRKS